MGSAWLWSVKVLWDAYVSPRSLVPVAYSSLEFRREIQTGKIWELSTQRKWLKPERESDNPGEP